MDDYLWILKRDERDLIREIEPARMAVLSEVQLLALHQRIRRARNKHAGVYRRKASSRVARAGGRGAARPKNLKALLRAEAFEEALARVSDRLAEVSHQEAEALKSVRLQRAKKGKFAGPSEPSPGNDSFAGQDRTRVHEQTTGGLKRDASTRAQGNRRQKKRDSR